MQFSLNPTEVLLIYQQHERNITPQWQQAGEKKNKMLL